MIDEKKLIDDLLHNDGIEFEVQIADFTPEGFKNAFQEFTNKMKEGIVALINAQPSFGWISVNERLPKEQQEVLVCADSGETQETAIWTGFRWNVTWNHQEIINVTHWMPLPESPKDGEP